MKIAKTNEALATLLQDAKAANHSIGFVPTMGALHAGHIALIEQSKRENQITVCSIFVNPTQFNDAADLAKYPRTEEVDAQKLEKVDCDILYLPTVDEVYPSDWQSPDFDLGHFDSIMEGKMRPGHFKGMAQVVYRLLYLVRPNKLYMGQKDLQQFTIIKHLIPQFNLGFELICAPIVREADGLAMSSRNVRLSEDERAIAPLIYKTLTTANPANFKSPSTYRDFAITQLEHAYMKVEYVEVVDRNSLLPVNNWTESQEKAICVAVQLGPIRLIDNIFID
ncbi:MAG: pantoate--beta-alanine ligase [Chitinophagales bacterium]|nr:pantoate--beta-alanine ligase [Chitinophagales bacterium]